MAFDSWDSSGVILPTALRRASVRSGTPITDAIRDMDMPLLDSKARNALYENPRSTYSISSAVLLAAKPKLDPSVGLISRRRDMLRRTA
jgi:hypothetical protein